MGGGYGFRYLGVDLSLRQSQNSRAWGIGTRYRVGRVNLENQTLVYCGGGLES